MKNLEKALEVIERGSLRGTNPCSIMLGAFRAYHDEQEGTRCCRCSKLLECQVVVSCKLGKEGRAILDFVRCEACKEPALRGCTLHPEHEHGHHKCGKCKHVTIFGHAPNCRDEQEKATVCGYLGCLSSATWRPPLDDGRRIHLCHEHYMKAQEKLLCSRCGTEIPDRTMLPAHMEKGRVVWIKPMCLLCTTAPEPAQDMKLEAGCRVVDTDGVGTFPGEGTVISVDGDMVWVKYTSGAAHRGWHSSHLTVTEAAVPEVGDYVCAGHAKGIIHKRAVDGGWWVKHQYEHHVYDAKDFTIICKGKGA